MTHGDERALLLLHENGSPMAGLFGTRSACQLVVFDPNANPSVAFGLCENGPGLVLQDFSGVPRLAASITDGIPNLVMRDENGKVQQTLLPSPDPVQGPNAATRPP